MKKIFRHKKGLDAIEKSFYYAIFAFVLSAVLLLFMYYVGSEGSLLTKVPKGLNEDIFYSMMINSNCFAYHDLNSGRILTGVIDWEKFNQYNLDACYYITDKNKAGYRLTLKNLATGQEKTPLTTANFDKKDKSLTKKVQIMYKDKLCEGDLGIEIQKA